ncbi:hypothetical protein QBC41DRAFT_312284 [Cercophora samala]|uniref:Uncharacterized protein n=1 Tax=Cercophora samala TaxID=330535 RepID=A0AA39ZLZ2_9PEZI|nr:hypothetical protein QBC41DRAFT_312284 [Cercophora samala]
MKFLSLFALAAQAVSAALLPIEARGQLMARECYPGEIQTLFCYKRGQGTPQNVEVNDIAAAASALRQWGMEWREKLDQNGNPVFDDNGLSIEEPFYRYLEMNTTTAPNCGEWTIFRVRSVLVAAKLMVRRKNAVVWYNDIANAIDGGEFASDADKKAAIIGCGTDGGSREVKATVAHEAYDPYRAAFNDGTKSPTDIVIKIVEDIDWKNAQD